jgi:bifunctional DNA-binding transcriptional regulator/antitoxin component of YhaV-PrlF toxin-antitoxin module
MSENGVYPQKDVPVMPTFDAEVVVRDRNQLTLPSAIVDARKITRGMRFVVHIDDEHPDVIVLRTIPNTYAGKLKGVYGNSTDDELAYVRGERDWGA